MQRVSVLLVFLFLLTGGFVLIACGQSGEPAATEVAEKPAPEPAQPAASSSQTPADLDQALVLSLATFAPREKGSRDLPKPLPARMEFLVREGGVWKVRFIDDEQSNVFHKAMLYTPASGDPAILSVAGSAATVKLWRMGALGPEATTLWEKDFGGKFSRMRDVEIADIYGDGRASMAVATHDQGVVATLRPQDDGSFEVIEIDAEPDTFVHEIEIGDLDGDGVLEVYATLSEPNRLDGTPQSGQVVRYVPAKGEGRVVVADLGDRHAKEILVDDLDGNGRDELYVVVEGKVAKGSKVLEKKVEIRRYEAGTDPREGVVIGEIPDRLCRFLTAGDIDGDGQKELVAAAFSSGLWLLQQPSGDPQQAWRVTSIDRNSGGFEHAAILADLDHDGRDELYVASDKHKEVRRYTWQEDRLIPETLYVRPSDSGGVFTWNIMPVPVSLMP